MVIRLIDCAPPSVALRLFSIEFRGKKKSITNHIAADFLFLLSCTTTLMYINVQILIYVCWVYIPSNVMETSRSRDDQRCPKFELHNNAVHSSVKKNHRMIHAIYKSRTFRVLKNEAIENEKYKTKEDIK